MNQTNETNPIDLQETKRKRRNDLILIAALLVILTVTGLLFALCREEGSVVTVEIDGELVGSYSLAEDRTVEIRTGENDAQYNRLVIRDGKAFVEDASCPDGICAAHKPIHRMGESIVCLPHRVVVTVRGTQSDNEPDIVV